MQYLIFSRLVVTSQSVTWHLGQPISDTAFGSVNQWHGIWVSQSVPRFH